MCFSVLQNKLIERDLEALQAQLMETSMTDASGLSFFEHFHISPIKVMIQHHFPLQNTAHVLFKVTCDRNLKSKIRPEA